MACRAEFCAVLSAGVYPADKGSFPYGMAAAANVCICAELFPESADAGGAHGDHPRCDGRMAEICDHLYPSAARDVFHHSVYRNTAEKEAE